jgi:hypothetical protein
VAPPAVLGACCNPNCVCSIILNTACYISRNYVAFIAGAKNVQDVSNNNIIEKVPFLSIFVSVLLVRRVESPLPQNLQVGLLLLAVAVLVMFRQDLFVQMERWWFLSTRRSSETHSSWILLSTFPKN